jgi:hypothetical protein
MRGSEEMAVPEILKLVPLVGLGRVVGGRVGRGFERATRSDSRTPAARMGGVESLARGFSVARANPSACVPFKTMASSLGALTLLPEIRTLRHESRSMPSRLVSMVRLSIPSLRAPAMRR